MEHDVNLLVLTTAITLLLSTAVSDSDPLWYYCNSDICNVDELSEPIDFCSEVFKRCRPCAEVLDDCFTPRIPMNCSSSCIKHQVKLQMREAREKKCAALKPILNGEQNGSLTDLHDQGDVVGFSCDIGYRLKGVSNIRCRGYGVWSSAAPTCEEVICPLLNDVTDGFHNGSVSSLKPGDKVITLCAHGYQLCGYNFTVCSSDGFWTNPLPLCKRIACSVPHPIRNGLWQSSQRTKEKYQVGDVAKASCHEGYLLDGAELWNCSHDGNWISSPDSNMPVCFLAGGSSDRKSYVGWIIMLGILLFVSVCVNIGLSLYVCGTRHKRQRGINMTDVHTCKDVMESDISYANEHSKLLKPEDSMSAKDETVSLRDQKQTREKIVPAGTDLPPASPFTSSKTKDTKAETGAGIVMNFYNNNTNTNRNTIINESTATCGDQQPTQPPSPPTADTRRPEAQPERGQEDKTPVEESGTVHPQQPESSGDNSDTKFAENGHNTDHQTFPKDAHIREDYGDALRPGFPVQQNVNNEQDIAQKVILPDTEINRDDIDV